MLEIGEKAEILFAGRFHSPGGVDFGSRNLPDTLVAGLHSRVETRVRTAMLGTNWEPPCTSDPRICSGLVVRFTCFSDPARFSGRITRSAGDLPPRERECSVYPPGDQSPDYFQLAP